MHTSPGWLRPLSGAPATTCHLKPALQTLTTPSCPFLKELISQIIRTPPSHAYRNIGLVRDVVALTHERCSDTALTMSDLTQRLFTSKTVLSVAIRQATGLSPLPLMRNVRLERVRKALLSGVHSASVGDVALRYGFPSRGHFSRYYSDLFGELPRETLMKR